jgi:hypothetical protein
MIEHPITFIDGNDDEYTINDLTYRDLLTAPYYFIKVDSVDGYWGADVAYESHPIPGGIGERSGDIYRRGKTITLSGTIYARNLQNLREGQRYLAEMFWDTGIRKLVYKTWEAPEELYLNCRVIQDLAMIDRVENNNFRVNWTIALRADDPRSRKLSDHFYYPSYTT